MLRKIVFAKIKHITQRLNLYTLCLYGVIFLFLCTVAFVTLRSSVIFSTNSDALIATQQLSGNVAGNTIGLPAPHSNILMIPILFIQAHLDYNYKSFVLLNFLLMLLTFGGWIILLIRLFGRKYEIFIIVTVSALLFASVPLNLNMANTTFRNIAYPISLWFLMNIAKFFQRQNRLQSRISYIEVFLSVCLFSLVLAGDSFFNYVIIIPLFIFFAWTWIYKRKITIGMAYALGAVIAPILIAQALKLLLATSNIIHYDHTLHAPPTILPFEHLGASVTVLFRQLLELQGAMIFGKAVVPSNVLPFANIVVFIFGCLGIVGIIKSTHANLANKTLPSERDFTLSIIGISFFVVIFEYVLSGYAVIEIDGNLVDYLNSRYITFLPLIIILGLVWFIKNIKTSERSLYFLSVAFVLAMILYYPSVKSSYAYEDQNKRVPSRASINEISNILRNNQVKQVVTDFWYGPPLAFWTKGEISYAPQMFCNAPMSFDSRSDWFIPQENIKSALLIDRGGLNYWYWQCSDSELIKIYGKPIKEILVDGVTTNEKVKIWIYNYDTRKRLQHFPS